MNVKQIGILTDTNGDFTTSVAGVSGEILTVALVIGDLSTPDVTITDKLTGESIFAKTGIAASDSWNPRRLVTGADGVDIAGVYSSTIALRGVTIVVAGAGSIKSGTLYITSRG